MTAIFPNEGETTAASAAAVRRLIYAQRLFRAAVARELQRRGEWDANAAGHLAQVRRMGWVWIGAAAAFTAVAPVVWPIAGAGALLLPLAPLLVGVANGIAGSRMPPASPAGRRKAAAWNAYAAFLKNAASHPHHFESAQQYEAELVHAVALDAVTEWSKALAGCSFTAPAWYRGVGGAPAGALDVVGFAQTVQTAPGERRRHAARVAALRTRTA